MISTEGPPPPPPPHIQNYGPHFQDANNRDTQPFFQYSQCTGKKKALCVCSLILIGDQSSTSIFQIGINYFGQTAELKGCINDANNMQAFLCSEQELHLLFT